MASNTSVSPFLGWDRHDIFTAIRRRKSNLTKIALDAGLYACACRQALCRHHYRGERALADFLEVEPKQLWPERYDDDGVPLNPITRQMHFKEKAQDRPRQFDGETLTAKTDRTQ